MQIWIVAFCTLAILNSLFLMVLLVKKRPYKSSADVLLALLLLALSLRVSKSIFYYVYPDISFFAISVGLMGKLAIGPLLYLYMKVSHSKMKLAWTDALHFAPSLIAITTGWAMGINELVLGYWSGTIILGAYLAASWKKQYSRKESNQSSTASITTSFMVGVSIIWATFVFQIFSTGIEMYTLGTLMASLVLYGLIFKLAVFTVKKSKTNGNKASLSRQKMEKVRHLIEQHFTNEKVYLDSNINLNEFSKSIEQPAYVVSHTINHVYGKKFPEFVNSYRIKEVKSILLNQVLADYTIEGVAYEVGFNTPSAFYNAFKKETGCSPKEFIGKGKEYSVL
ncbi:helix-turn-helix transcriptional regulator [Muricauda sp. CAU 1633]|nr:helix-turn-helix transcriptional regulator [Muricauda sp. CAU 1633]